MYMVWLQLEWSFRFRVHKHTRGAGGSFNCWQSLSSFAFAQNSHIYIYIRDGANIFWCIMSIQQISVYKKKLMWNEKFTSILGTHFSITTTAAAAASITTTNTKQPNNLQFIYVLKNWLRICFDIAMQ